MLDSLLVGIVERLVPDEPGEFQVADVRSDELVILVHGTFAGDNDQRDEGMRWWQRGSATWEALAARLPEGAALPDEEIRLFHWSGANAQSKRLQGGTQLLALLLELEEQGRSYHLVGHSHGGSVIWEALVSAQIITEDPGEPPNSLMRRRGKQKVRSGAQLLGLRSVTTVGTPFLHFLPRLTRFGGWRHPRYVLSRDDSPVYTLAGTAALLMAVVGVLGLLILGLRRSSSSHSAIRRSLSSCRGACWGWGRWDCHRSAHTIGRASPRD